MHSLCVRLSVFHKPVFYRNGWTNRQTIYADRSFLSFCDIPMCLLRLTVNAKSATVQRLEIHLFTSHTEWACFIAKHRSAFLTPPVQYAQHGLSNGPASVRPSVCLSVPSIDSSNGGRRVCCWAPCSRRRRSAAIAGSVTLTADGGGSTQTRLVEICNVNSNRVDYLLYTLLHREHRRCENAHDTVHASCYTDWEIVTNSQ